MADVAAGDDDPLRDAGRARGEDQIGRIVGRRAAQSRIGRGVARLRDLRIDPERRADALLRLFRESRRGQQPLGLGVGEADRDAFYGRAGVEGQKGRPGEGDGELRDEELGTARHPKADRVARTHAARDEPLRDRPRHRLDLAIGEAALERRQSDRMRVGGCGSAKNLAEQLVAQQVRDRRPAQRRERPRWRLVLRRPGVGTRQGRQISVEFVHGLSVASLPKGLGSLSMARRSSLFLGPKTCGLSIFSPNFQQLRLRRSLGVFVFLAAQLGRRHE